MIFPNFQFHFGRICKNMIEFMVSKWNKKGWYEPYFGIECSLFQDFGGGWFCLVLPFVSISYRFYDCLCGCDKNDSKINISWE